MHLKQLFLESNESSIIDILQRVKWTLATRGPNGWGYFMQPKHVIFWLKHRNITEVLPKDFHIYTHIARLDPQGTRHNAQFFKPLHQLLVPETSKEFHTDDEFGRGEEVNYFDFKVESIDDQIKITTTLNYDYAIEPLEIPQTVTKFIIEKYIKTLKQINIQLKKP